MEENFIRVDTEGNLLYKGSKLTHEKILDFFKSLDFEEVGENEYLFKWKIGDIVQKIKVIPDDTLFIIRDLIQSDGIHYLVLNDDSKEPFNREDLYIDGDIPYTHVKEGKLRARFNRYSAFKLGEIFVN